MTTVITSASTIKSFSSKKLLSCSQSELSTILSWKNVALATLNLDEEGIKEEDDTYLSFKASEFDSSFVGGTISKREILSLL